MILYSPLSTPNAQRTSIPCRPVSSRHPRHYGATAKTEPYNVALDIAAKAEIVFFTYTRCCAYISMCGVVVYVHSSACRIFEVFSQYPFLTTSYAGRPLLQLLVCFAYVSKDVLGTKRRNVSDLHKAEELFKLAQNNGITSF